jgi:hypothetical protein
LRQFVADSLSQIVAGVADARCDDPKIAPPASEFPAGSGLTARHGGVAHPRAFIVEFDVAVSTSEKSNVDAKGGLAVHLFEAGLKRTTSSEASTVSRMKFEVPLTFDEIPG